MEVAIHTLKIDPELQGLVQPLTPDELTRLEESIRAEGCRDPVVTWNETIIDGHHRYDICHRNRVPFRYEEKTFVDKDAVKVWMINHQLGRRNLTSYQRSALVLKEKNILEKDAKEEQQKAGKQYGKGGETKLGKNSSQAFSPKRAPKTREKLAQKAGVSHDTIRKVEKIEEEADEETKKKLATGEIKINKAYTELRAPVMEPETTVEDAPQDEDTALEIVGIKKAGAMNYIVMWSDGSANSVSRQTLFGHGYRKCGHCSGYGVVAKANNR